MISFICFLILSILIFIGSLAAVAYGITGNKVSDLEMYNNVDLRGNIKNLEMIEKLDGWVEKLNENYEIVKVYGKKKTTQMQYQKMRFYI